MKHYCLFLVLEELISPISRGWRWSVLHRIEKAINRPYLHTSKLVLHFNMEYSLELEVRVGFKLIHTPSHTRHN